MNDFIPRSDADLSAWSSSLKTKLATHAKTFGISDADLLIHQNDCDEMVDVIIDYNNTKLLWKNKLSIKRDTRSDKVGNFRTLANRIKSHPAYTEAIGNDLGFIGSEDTFDINKAKPTIKASITGGHSVISFDRQKSNGVKIYGKRGSETVFSFLALDTHSPYHDNRENLTAGTPETRQYCAYYIDNSDEQFGLESDVVSVTL